MSLDGRIAVYVLWEITGVMHVDLEVDRGRVERGLKYAVREKFPDSVGFTRPELRDAHPSSSTDKKQD